MSLQSLQSAPLAPAKPVSTLRRWLASRRNTQRAEQIGILVVLTIGAVIMIIPFVWMVGTSFSRSANTAMPRIPRLWPADPSLFNYQVAVTNLPIIRYYFNSFLVTGLATVGYLFISALSGYAFAKGRFPGKTFFFLALLTTLMIPFEIRMIPLYFLMKTLHINDTPGALILPFLAGGFGTFLMRQFISTIPDDLVDAARVDGASELLIFWRIVLPLCGPVLAALAVLTALWRWNDVLWPLLTITDRNWFTVTLGLATAGRAQGIYTGVALANASLAILPIILLYLLLQRYIIRGITLTGLRG